MGANEAEAARNGFDVVAICLGILLVATLGAQLPVPAWWRAYRATAVAVWPQGWGFFAQQPTPEVVAYAPDGSGWRSLMVTPQGRGANLLGLSRRQRAQAPEIDQVVAALPADGWRSCAAATIGGCSAVVRSAPSTRVADPSTLPTLCGTTVFAVEQLQGSSWQIDRIGVAEVTCATR